MAAAFEGDSDPFFLDQYRPSGLDEAAVELLGCGLSVSPQPRRQPAVTTVGNHSQRRIQVDVEPYLAGQAIEMEEVHADAQAILDAVATRVADDQLTRCLIEVIGDEQGWMVMPQPGDRDLADRSLVLTRQ